MITKDDGTVIDESINQDELIAIWDVRDAVFTFHAETNKLPESFDDLLDLYKSLKARPTEQVPGIPDEELEKAFSSIFDKVQSLPTRLPNLTFYILGGGEDFKYSFLGADSQTHEYHPFSPEYPVAISEE